ncbi:hypothetical protein LJ084_003960 [Salmonella enterica]|nr:hypothetical protein [Salmonella enterica]EJE9216757.1 hypothetical protein [Salmonella enterica]ELT9219065.1 hypothetical protein [Salmonella enterica]
MWLVFNIGCIECGVSSNVVGVFADKAEADAIAENLSENHGWREGGQNSYEVFELNDLGVLSDEYRNFVTL